MLSEELDRIRLEILSSEVNEYDLRDNFPLVKSKWDKIQALMSKRAEEKSQALADIDEKYNSELQKLEEDYAFALRMSAGGSGV